MNTSHPSGKRGIDILRDPRWNRGTAFNREERAEYGLLGLLPDIVSTREGQMARIEAHIDSLPTNLDKYVYFTDLQERNQAIYYRILMKDPVKYMPIVYTPTVGEACQTFGRIYRRPQGLYISVRHRGRMAQCLRNWPEKDVKFIVVTDGERILGLGDLGAQGMGISIGKLALYTTVGSVPPHVTLPIVLDVGTNNTDLMEDPFYIGVPQRRLEGDDYASFVEEFVTAVEEVYPDCTIQWEDFANHNAVTLLERYRERIPSFNDDIQGTAAVGLAGIISGVRGKGESIAEQTYLFYGAGSAGMGIADLLTTAMLKEGLTAEEARKRIWLFDSKGLVTAARTDLGEQKQRYAHDGPDGMTTNSTTDITTLEGAVRAVSATALIGTSTMPKAFTQEVIEGMAANTARPIIFPFSNPTSKSECTAEEAYTWTNGAAIFASGSPFPSFEYAGKTITPSQGNNVYIFPAMGLAVLAAKPSTIPDRAFSRAARSLAALVSQEQFERGIIFPPLDRIREASLIVATAIVEYFYEAGLATMPKPDDVAEYVRSIAWEPEY